jgi:hypothetical protein
LKTFLKQAAVSKLARRAGFAAFLLFLIKGLVWLLLPLLFY